MLSTINVNVFQDGIWKKKSVKIVPLPSQDVNIAMTHKRALNVMHKINSKKMEKKDVNVWTVIG